LADREETALAIGAFSTTLTTLSLSLMGWRNLSSNNVFIGNFFFVAGVGMVISAQWELVLGNSYGYTVLSAFGLFYGGFGAIITPALGVHLVSEKVMAMTLRATTTRSAFSFSVSPRNSFLDV
jgi:succinate-acetate transporter protein